MQAGIAQKGRKTLAMSTVAVLVLSLMFLLADPAARADHVQPDDVVPHSAEANQAPFWETYLVDVREINDASCDKIDESGGSAFVMPAAANGETWVLLVVKQATTNFVYYDPIGGHPYPSAGETGPGFSHLIVCSVVTPTTTSVPVTTTVLETTTSVPETTSTSAEVLPTSITAAPSTTAEVDPIDTLPFTGVESGTPALLALALIAIGALALVATRKVED
jgi:LPXTG-motif cell wall-anchored protein